MFKKITTGAILLFMLTILAGPQIMILPGCANIIPPSGGPRDTLPPVLLKAIPADSTRNFQGNKISFSFNEYIDVQNVHDNLIVSPVPKIDPVVTFKLSSMNVKLKDTLEPNTTYSLNFGNAVKDYTEGNVLKNFTYVFSTGKSIDSLELHGKVILAEDGKTDSTLIAVLHIKADDSAVIKDRPRYVSKLDRKGNFVFKYLPPGTFYLYAFKDQGGSRRFIDNKQLFAFADKPVVIGQQKESDTLVLYAYAIKQSRQSFSTTPVPVRKPTGGLSDKRLKFQTNLANGKMDLLDSLSISFEVPIRLYDSSKISFSSDSTFIPINNYSFKKDSLSMKLTLNYPWKENTLYHLVIDKNFAEDTTGKKLLRTDTITFFTRRIDEYGKLTIRFRNLDLSKNPVLIFVQSGEIKKSFPLSSVEFSQALFFPGDYDLRILYDANKNGIWDPGDFFGKHKQPEIVRPVERHITVRPDYDNDFEIMAPPNSP